jgi:hypothetical protein
MKPQLIEATHSCGCEIGYVVVLVDCTVAEFKAAMATEPCRFCKEEDEEDERWKQALRSIPAPIGR